MLSIKKSNLFIFRLSYSLISHFSQFQNYYIMRRILFLTTLIFITGLTTDLKPQSSETNAFSDISLTLNLISNHSTDELNTYWTGKSGFEGYLQMPFYFGDIQAGARYIAYKEKELYFHNFSSLYYFLGWGKKFNLPLNFSFYSGIRVGGFGTAIVDDSLNGEEKNETELAVGINSYLALRINNNLRITVGADYTKVYFYKKIELFLLSAGMSYSFQTPAWIKEILN